MFWWDFWRADNCPDAIDSAFCWNENCCGKCGFAGEKQWRSNKNPTCFFRWDSCCKIQCSMVAAIWFEQMTDRVWTDCSSQLSYAAKQNLYILYPLGIWKSRRTWKGNRKKSFKPEWRQAFSASLARGPKPIVARWPAIAAKMCAKLNRVENCGLYLTNFVATLFFN